MNEPISTASYVPVNAPTPFMSVSPIVFVVPGRQTELQIKVSAPISGSELPIILLSHGHGQSTYLSSLRGYNPLAEFYAAHGFAVIQPTHLDSKALGLEAKGPEGALFWAIIYLANPFRMSYKMLTNGAAHVCPIQALLSR